ncbi:acyl-CoA dehydrogenase family protein [Acrocarpospora macrocephala]|uniref:Acyl-CoA dehydrogenase n=1 Tax=Acrocarpospora macrocephala TaxID=150177 RepID=A0A5M3X3Z5_9ACTN|nr:acyl-CoA dehydrogenase family protein [Acrocarpospora macrocephala]GES13563.1 acyl-CoA dehydrogenase [Acrocarpospora macrocephala]
MTLLYTEIEEQLRAAVRELLTDKATPGAADGGELWKVLARDIGVAGLLIPEEFGGAGASAREAAVVLEELGRTVAPVPYLTSAVLATRALLTAADVTDIADLLERLAAGETTATLAVPFASSPYRPPLAARVGGDASESIDRSGAPEAAVVGSTISGRIAAVAGADMADTLLVPVGAGLAVVSADDPGVTVTPVTSLDTTRPIATVELSSASARFIAIDPSALQDTLAFGAGLLASEQLGVAEWCLTSTVGYLRERTQFARPVGSFQALKHRLADLWLEIVGARAAARNAADQLASGWSHAARVAVAVAQAHCGAVAVHAAEECVQLHGGIGMTWEHPAHLYLKRAKTSEIALGTPGDHREALADLVDLPGPA